MAVLYRRWKSIYPTVTPRAYRVGKVVSDLLKLVGWTSMYMEDDGGLGPSTNVWPAVTDDLTDDARIWTEIYKMNDNLSKSTSPWYLQLKWTQTAVGGIAPFYVTLEVQTGLAYDSTGFALVDAGTAVINDAGAPYAWNSDDATIDVRFNCNEAGVFVCELGDATPRGNGLGVERARNFLGTAEDPIIIYALGYGPFTGIGAGTPDGWGHSIVRGYSEGEGGVQSMLTVLPTPVKTGVTTVTDDGWYNLTGNTVGLSAGPFFYSGGAVSGVFGVPRLINLVPGYTTQPNGIYLPVYIDGSYKKFVVDTNQYTPTVNMIYGIATE